MSPVQTDLGPNAAEYVWINSLLSISAAAILYYEYLLTLPREIQFLWPPHNKLGWFTFACLLNRYLPVLGHIPILASYFMIMNGDSTAPEFDQLQFCEGLHVYDEWFVMLMQTHAVSALLFLGAASVVTATSALFASRRAGGETIPVLSNFAGCSQFTPSVGGKFAAIAWTGVLLSDCVIFSLTLYKAFTMGSGIKLLNVIVRDGTMYFSLSNTLVSRLVLNLRERNSSLAGLPTTVETVQRFQEGLPAARQSVTSAGNPSFVRPNESRSRHETATIGTVGASR
ncbi:hypothetical protein BJV74DRAFT_799741 [Russula compacta]|nr:hypothetical protein BJV74DRAFT_799741 [Russula compacta]